MEGVISLNLGASERSLSQVAWSNSTWLFTFSFCFPLLHFCSKHKLYLNTKHPSLISVRLQETKLSAPSLVFCPIGKVTITFLKNKNLKFKQETRTFFFCLPPPDLAGFEEGGGALSFFGACESHQNTERNKHIVKLESGRKKRLITFAQKRTMKSDLEGERDSAEAHGSRERAESTGWRRPQLQTCIGIGFLTVCVRLKGQINSPKTTSFDQCRPLWTHGLFSPIFFVKKSPITF